jgi:hypothetical protein
VTEDKDFQKRVQRIGGLVHELDAIVDPAASSACKALVQSLMELHGQALERMLDVVFQSANAGTPLIDELGQDPLVSSLLILYGLHPEDLQTRVQRKIEQLGSKLSKMGAAARLVSVNGGDLRLHASVEGHGCGSTAKTVRAMLEEATYEAAPDLISLVIEGLEEPAASGFVGLEKLMGSSAAQPAQLRSEGMD